MLSVIMILPEAALAQQSTGSVHRLMQTTVIEQAVGSTLKTEMSPGVRLTMNRALEDLSEWRGAVISSFDAGNARLWAKRGWIAGAQACIALGAMVSKWNETVREPSVVRQGLYLGGAMFYFRGVSTADEVNYDAELALPLHRSDDVAVALRLFGQDSNPAATQLTIMTALNTEGTMSSNDVVPEMDVVSCAVATFFLVLWRRRVS